MASRQQTGFVHSVPIPSIYKTASKIARKVKEGEDSLKNLIYSCRKQEVKKVYALVLETFKRNDIIDEILQKSKLLDKEPRFDVWLAKIIIWDLLWGKQTLKRGCKPVEIILNHEENLRELVKDCKDSIQPILKHSILKPRYVRVNTLKITTDEAVNNFIDEGWNLVPFSTKSNYNEFQDSLSNLKPDEFMKDLHIPDLLIFPPKTEFHQHEAYKSGCIILQDKASCLPVHLLNPPPGSVVLDTCAAPGMKTTQLAALLQNEGIVYAVEVSSNRANILKQIVESAGATCVKQINKDVMEVKDNSCPDVEYILVDPSCSGSGITDRIEIIKSDFDTKMQRLKKLCNFQAKLLRHTMKSFPKVKRIVYSTCSLNSEENEDVVRQILETSREFKLIDAKEQLLSWNTKTSDIYPELGNMCIFATPEEDKTNGFFVAVFERLKEGEKNPYLNYELCKLFDKQSRSGNRCDNNQFHTNYSNNEKAENSLNKSADIKETETENIKRTILDDNSKYTDFPPEKLKEFEKSNKNKKKRKVNDSGTKEEITDFYSENSGQVDPQEDQKKKDKKKKLKKESYLTDPPMQHSTITENISNEKHYRDTEPILLESVHIENTSIVIKKKKKNEILEEDNNKREKKKKDKNSAIAKSEIDITLDHKKSMKKKSKHDVLDSEETENVSSENLAVLDVSKQKRSKKQKKKNSGNEKEITDYSLLENSSIENTAEKELHKDVETVSQESVQSEPTPMVIKKKKKNKTLQEDNNVEVFNHKREKKKNKDKKLSIEGTDSENIVLCSDNLSVLDEAEPNKKTKKQKINELRDEKEIADSLLENSSNENTSLKEKRKKNKGKKSEKESENLDTRLEDENTEEINISLDGKKRNKTKKRKRAISEEENLEQQLMETQGEVNSKEKKKKK